MFVKQSIQGACTLLICALLLCGCQNLPAIHSLQDDTANFNNYTTFAFHPNLMREANGYDKISTRYIKNAIVRQMENKGYQYSDDAELWVNFNTFTKEKIRTIETIEYYPYYHYRYGYEVWGGYPHHRTRIDQYTEGTLNIDVIDRKTNRLLWEGIAIGKLSKRTLDNLEEKINEAVQLIFNTYPI